MPRRHRGRRPAKKSRTAETRPDVLAALEQQRAQAAETTSPPPSSAKPARIVGFHFDEESQRYYPADAQAARRKRSRQMRLQALKNSAEERRETRDGGVLRHADLPAAWGRSAPDACSFMTLLRHMEGHGCGLSLKRLMHRSVLCRSGTFGIRHAPETDGQRVDVAPRRRGRDAFEVIDTGDGGSISICVDALFRYIRIRELQQRSFCHPTVLAVAALRLRGREGTAEEGPSGVADEGAAEEFNAAVLGSIRAMTRRDANFYVDELCEDDMDDEYFDDHFREYLTLDYYRRGTCWRHRTMLPLTYPSTTEQARCLAIAARGAKLSILVGLVNGSALLSTIEVADGRVRWARQFSVRRVPNGRSDCVAVQLWHPFGRSRELRGVVGLRDGHVVLFDFALDGKGHKWRVARRTCLGRFDVPMFSFLADRRHPFVYAVDMTGGVKVFRLPGPRDGERNAAAVKTLRPSRKGVYVGDRNVKPRVGSIGFGPAGSQEHFLFVPIDERQRSDWERLCEESEGPGPPPMPIAWRLPGLQPLRLAPSAYRRLWDSSAVPVDGTLGVDRRAVYYNVIRRQAAPPPSSAEERAAAADPLYWRVRLSPVAFLTEDLLEARGQPLRSHLSCVATF